MPSCKGCITHHPVTRCDPVDEGDHIVDVENLLKVLGHKDQPVVNAPHRMDIGSNSPSRATFSVDNFHHLIGHSGVLANHVSAPSVVMQTIFVKSQFLKRNCSKTKFA